MSTELQEKVSKYKKELRKQLEELEQERQALIEKFNAGTLTKKERERNSEISTLMSDIEAKLSAFYNLEAFEHIDEDLVALADQKTSKTKKSSMTKEILSQFRAINRESLTLLASENGLSVEEISDLEHTRDGLKQELAELSVALKIAKENNMKTKMIEDQIETKTDVFNEIEDYLKNCFDIEAINSDLTTLANNDTSEKTKKAIIAKYQAIINDFKEYYTKEIIESIEPKPIPIPDPLPPKDEDTKEKNTQAAVLASIIGIAILCTGIIIAAGIRDKNTTQDNNTNNDLDNDTPDNSQEEILQDPTRELIEQLIAKGYNEFDATKMVENFSTSSINSLLATPFNEAVESYSHVKDFDPNYIRDYEEAISIYNITTEDAVSYVNRANRIQQTGFISGASINDIVEIIKAIDDNTIINSPLEQVMYYGMTEIYNNYIYNEGPTSNEDLVKLNALRYFATPEGDLHNFLTEYSKLLQSILINKNDASKKESITNINAFLDTFANTFAGNIQGSEVSSENAILANSKDWGIAYRVFIIPSLSFAEPEEFTEEHNAYICTQINMLSNYEQWIQLTGCGFEEDPTVGGR